MFTFSLQIVVVLVVVSGLIAFVGDWIGRVIGRRRLTIFNLRPRYTAMAVTVFSGVLIALFTFLSIIAISKDARTALFGLEELRAQTRSAQEELARTRSELTDILNRYNEVNGKLEKKNQELANMQDTMVTAKEEISILENLREGLNAKVENARTGTLLYRKGEVILVALMESNRRSTVEEQLDNMLKSVNAYMEKFAVEPGKDMIELTNYDYAATYISAHPGQNVLKAVVDSNVVLGQVVPIRLELVPNDKLFNKGEVIASGEIAETRQAAVEEKLKQLLSRAHQLAKEKGIVPDVSGSIGKIQYSEIFETARDVLLRNRKVKVDVITTRDIYSVGPLDVEFKLQ